LTTAASSSFPSGHATQSLGTFVALALVGAAFVGRARAAAVVLAVVLGAWVGWSRVYLGVHWATDVVAGWLIGAVWVVAVAWLAARAGAAGEQRLRARAPETQGDAKPLSSRGPDGVA
jgi:undecaprenyl-diphosphatase